MAHNLRVCITGGPKTGKTTMANQSQGTVLHTDSTRTLGWEQASDEVARWLDDPGPWTIEGVRVPHALRKWLAKNPKGKPCDVLIVLTTPHATLTSNQIAMGKGLLTVLQGIATELEARGIIIQFYDN